MNIVFLYLFKGFSFPFRRQSVTFKIKLDSRLPVPS